ncbi:hypothetical protein RJ639_020390 [Escallonia herrerae]|uniref:RNA helicase n=1 Tax=Escallonia herrerae TaxID=1293975 RepID=A0AA89AGS9_9ASTE|nr:hypothetical protein RJ639_020390 [Escallonia herrerae]
MNSLMLIKRSASLPSKRFTIASLETLLRHDHFSSSPATTNDRFLAGHAPTPAPSGSTFTPHSGFGAVRRHFHVGGSGPPLNFRASFASQASGCAVADYSDEDKSSSRASGDEGLEIAKLGISKEIVKRLADKGILKLFPIQKAVLEPAMQGRDMIGRARTGTGKTLAFGIPIMDKIIQYNAKHGAGRNPQALILAPTRELARQVEKEFQDSAHSVETVCVYGGMPIQRQMSSLDHGVDVVVGTPGRVIDLIKRGALVLSEVKFLVLDEADQMLNVGFADDVETILENLPRKRQTMMFSATMPNWIRKLTEKYLNSPLVIDLVGNSDQKLAEGITLYSIVSEMNQRSAIVGPLITEHAKGGKCIVFTQTKRDADRLAYAMQRQYPCEALHGDISQAQRDRTLQAFRRGDFNILVATDVAARGLDVPNVDLIVHLFSDDYLFSPDLFGAVWMPQVIHYELPNTSETFVHRSGRTGRAGKKGSAILIYSSHQMRDVKTYEREVGCKFAELPRIAVEAGDRDMLSDIGGSRGGGRFGNSGFGRSGGYSSSGYSRSGGSGSGRFGGYGSGDPNPSRGRSGGGFGGPSSGRGGNYGGPGSGRSGGFGSDRSTGFGSDRSTGFGNLGSSDCTSGFGEFGSGRSSQFGSFRDDKF